MAMVPYRESDLPTRAPDAAHEIVYRPQSKNPHNSARRMYVRYFVIVMPVAGILAAFHWGASLALVALVIAWDVFRVRRERAGIRLALDGTDLVVGAGAEPRRVPMATLVNVRLDTRVVSSTGAMVRADGILGPGPSLSVDESRIELVVTGGEPMRLTDAYFSQSDSLEWLGRIRRFLRAHGWVPEDERHADADVPDRLTHHEQRHARDLQMEDAGEDGDRGDHADEDARDGERTRRRRTR
jgi:hypothetical protein